MTVVLQVFKQAVLHTWHIWSHSSDDWHVPGDDVLKFHGSRPTIYVKIWDY